MPKLYVMVGIQGSGKSTVAKDLSIGCNAVHLASDSIRKELFGDESSQEGNGKVFDLLYSRAREALAEGKNVIIDAMNISRKRRIHILTSEFRKSECEKIAVYMATPLEECIKNDEERSRTVTEQVIRNTFKNVDIPLKAEGWDEIWYCSPIETDDRREELVQYLFNCDNPSTFEKDIKQYLTSFDGLFRISHDNPHHSFSVGRHSFYALLKARELVTDWVSEDDKITLLLASTLHDVGKRYTKKFVDAKGNPSKYAHFYNHEKVSAQLALIDLLRMNFPRHIIDGVVDLIQFHMEMYKKPKNNGKRKVESFISEERFNQLLILNEADKAAH